MLTREATCKGSPFATNKLGLPLGTKIACNLCLDVQPYERVKMLCKHIVDKHHMPQDQADPVVQRIILEKLESVIINKFTFLP